jgi:hypothetical protein
MTIGTLRGRRLCKTHRHEPGYARFLTHPAVLPIFRSSATSSGWRGAPAAISFSDRLTLRRIPAWNDGAMLCVRKAVDVAVSAMIMTSISVRTSVLTSSAGFSCSAIRGDKINN